LSEPDKGSTDAECALKLLHIITLKLDILLHKETNQIFKVI